MEIFVSKTWQVNNKYQSLHKDKTRNQNMPSKIFYAAHHITQAWKMSLLKSLPKTVFILLNKFSISHFKIWKVNSDYA